MITTSFALLTLSLASQALGASGGSPPTARQAYDWANLSWQSGVAAIFIICIGLFLCFMGKRMFKPFLGLVGFVAGFLWAATIMGMVKDHVDFTDWVPWIIACIVGLIAGAICMYMWKVGVLVGAGLGGFVLSNYLMSLKVGGLIANQYGRNALVFGAVASCVLLAWFFESIVIVVTSAITGAVLAIFGLDVYVKSGFAQQLYEQVTSKTFTLQAFHGPIMWMFASAAALAVVGALFQLLSPSTGFGRAH